MVLFSVTYIMEVIEMTIRMKVYCFSGATVVALATLYVATQTESLFKTLATAAVGVVAVATVLWRVQ